jgi:hypothetical protein
VVEHSLGKGEVESSILSCSTIHSLEIVKSPCDQRAFPVLLLQTALQNGYSGWLVSDDDGLVSLSAQNAKAFVAGAEAKLALENIWIEALGSGKPALEVFGLATAIRG